jgi:predicted nuclease of restriction endonuclease-like (RecB) superfamily
MFSRTEPPETRELYILAAIRQRWTNRELERQIQSAAILRSDRAAKKVSPAVAQIHPAVEQRVADGLTEE